MPDLTVSVSPPPAVHASGQTNNAAGDAGNADNPSGFHALLSEQMAAGKARTTPTTPTATTSHPVNDTEKKADAATEDDKHSDDSAIQVVATHAVEALLPILPQTPVNGINIAPSSVAVGGGDQAIKSATAPITATNDTDVSAKSQLQAQVQFHVQLQAAAPQLQPQTQQTDAVTAMVSALETTQKSASARNIATNIDNTMPLSIAPANIAAPANTSAPTAAPIALQANVGTPAWNGELANTMSYVVGEKMQSAQLHLNPSHLGPVDVHIQIGNDQQTNISFVVANADTRMAIENAMPQLRQTLADSGISMSNFSVSADASAGTFQQHSGQQRGSGNGPASNSGSEPAIASMRTVSINGLVDVFV